MRRQTFSLCLAGLLAVGLGLRLAVIASPLGDLDGDEAVVGLMARHIALRGDTPVFYYGQPYLGSLEAFSAAPLFRLFDSSTLLLKLVPSAYSLGFLILSALLARRLFGVGVALATAAYLALPPAMWAVWSTKARGGYAELLFLGQAILLVTFTLAERPSRSRALGWGLLAGLALWTHLLAVVYVAPALVFLVLARRGRWSSADIGCVLVGGIVGMLPMILGNLSSGLRTVTAMTQPADLPLDYAAQFVRFFRVGVPVLLGLGQPTTSEVLFDRDWPLRPAGHLWVAAAALIVVGMAVLSHAPTLRRLVRGDSLHRAEPALLVLIGLCVPLVVAFTRFGFLVSEPRYALPLYSCVPLVMAALRRVPRPAIGAAALAAVLALNVWSLASTDIRLWQPEDTPDSNAATRADLVGYLVADDRHQMYTDYWIGYPVMFETRETVLAYVISGGFNRYVPPADNVQRTPNPAWVFAPGSEAESIFLDRLSSVGGQAYLAEVSVYHVYTNVEPLAAVRPHS